MMRIRKVHVRNFRKFLQPVTLAGLTDGVCVIAGDNEEGKSTVVQAIRSAFHLKYNTQSTQHIQPHNSSAMPEVCVDFDLGGVTYSLRKVFGKKGKAELRSEKGVFEGSEAEEKLHELCNAGAERKESSIWNVLWVEQGKTCDEIKLGDLGKRTLQGALERELGSIVGGDSGQQLIKGVGELYSKWFTATGKDFKNSEHKLAEEALAALDAKLVQATAELESLQTSLDHLETTRAALRNFEETRVLDSLEKSLIDLRGRKTEIEKHQVELMRAQELERTEGVQYKSADSNWKLRSNLIREVDSVITRLAVFEKQLEEAAAKQKQASEQLHDSATKREAAEGEYERLVAGCESAERLEQIKQLQIQTAQLQDSILRAEAAESLREQVRKEGETIKVKPEGLAKARDCERHVMQLEAQLQAVATRVDLAPSTSAAAATIGGAPVSSNELLLTETTVLTLPGWGNLIVTPGGGDLDKLRGNAERARIALAKSLETMSVATVEQADALDRRRSELLIEWKSHNAEVQRYAPAGIPALRDQLDIAQSQLAASLSTITDLNATSVSGSVSGQSASAHASQPIAELRAKRDAAKSQLAQLKNQAIQLETIFRDCDRALQTLNAQKDSATNELARITERLATERTMCTDDVLFQLVKEAELKLAAATKRREEVTTLLAQLNAAAIDAEIAAAERKLAEAHLELQRLRETQSRLEGVLQTLGKTGITEEVEKLRGKREQAVVHLQRAQRKARAIKLLNDTLCEAERSSKSALSAPLMRRLSPYMTELFANSNFQFDETNFGVMELQRGTSEPFSCLSLGTREQISILTRLAFAEALAESGAPAIVILDDALVYSDETRFLKMQELLKRASQRFQIIMLTCRERDYASMGVPIIRLADCVHPEGDIIVSPASSLSASHR